MIWKEFNDDYLFSSAGLMKKKVGSRRIPNGRMVMPKMKATGQLVYMYSYKGKQKEVIIATAMEDMFGKRVYFSEKWLQKVRELVVRLNGSKFVLRRADERYANWPPQWRVQDFSDPWDSYKPVGLISCEYSQSDLCPLI